MGSCKLNDINVDQDRTERLTDSRAREFLRTFNTLSLNVQSS